MRFDYLIVGAGFAGSVLAERIATQLNKKVLVVDKRFHIGGNCYDYPNEHGILIHKYGPHIFHTQAKKVWDYLSQFTEWYPYYHKVLADVEGIKVPVPFNFNSIYSVFPQNYASKLEDLLLEKYGYGIKVPILKLMENDNKDLKFLADYIYKHVFVGYTMKQWGLKPEEIDFSVTARVPVYTSRDDRYFQDQYQGIPKHGYTKVFEKLLAHPNIHVLLKTDYKDIIDDIKFDKMIYTGALDHFFDKMHGDLPYRSLEFDLQSYNRAKFQDVAQVNYPNSQDYTRITEFSHFLPSKSENTTVAYEYPKAYKEGLNDPYYPIPHEDNHKVFQKYKEEADKLKNVYFVGRLADYKYYNMDQIVGVALLQFEKNIAK